MNAQERVKKRKSFFFCSTFISSNRKSIAVSHNPESLYFFCFTTWNATRYQIPPVSSRCKLLIYTARSSINHFFDFAHHIYIYIQRERESRGYSNYN